jgi:hypothetical protein
MTDWSSLDHNLAFEATWQRTGGATLRVTLSPDLQRWQAEGTIDIKTWRWRALVLGRARSSSDLTAKARAALR